MSPIALVDEDGASLEVKDDSSLGELGVMLKARDGGELVLIALGEGGARRLAKWLTDWLMEKRGTG